MRRILLTLAFVFGAFPALAQNYNATAGSGLVFGSKFVGSVNYPQFVMCDPTTPSQCAAVNASGQITVVGSGTFVTQSVVTNAGTFAVQLSGATNNINNIAGTITLPTGASTSANQTSQITQETATAAAAGTPTDTPCTAPASATSCTMEAVLKALLNVGQYPSGAVATNGTNTGTTTAISTTLAATVSVTQYACWISVRSNATAVATGNVTLSDGTKTFNFTHITLPNASGVGITEQVFPLCIPATAANTAWTLTSPTPGAGGVVSVSIGGYKL